MKIVAVTIVAAIGASACCLGPVVFSLLGAGALGAASTRLEPARPLFLGLTFVLLSGAFVMTYRHKADMDDLCATDGRCSPATDRRRKSLLWFVTVLVVALAAFPYYVEWFI